MKDMTPETVAEAPGVAFAFSGKSKCHSQMTDMSPETLPEAPGVTFAFYGKSKCDSWGPHLVFLESYLSSMSDICFFQKKQM